MLSIEIPVTHGKYVKTVLDSIFSQKDDFEVIVVTSSKNFDRYYTNKILGYTLRFEGSI
ncbi:hypothetical protein [Candidatus Acidianus copahuensis]|nr:hypothetical protein [Candidatus Acidianus copahuensis]